MAKPPFRLASAWAALGPRFLPFADVATPDLPLSRLLRLSLFQVSVGMALVLLVGTLNRVMIVELGVPASLVAVMVALPVLFAPMRALIGFRSDRFQSELGWRRVPFIWRGSLLQFGGFAIMPFALLVLAGAGQSASAPVWVGYLAAATAFLLVGAGLHTVQTVGLSLATDLVADESKPKMVGLMYVTLLLGMLVSATAFGYALEEYSHGRLIQTIQAAAVITLILNAVAIWKQEPRIRRSAMPPAAEPQAGPFARALGTLTRDTFGLRWLWVVALGTLALTMQDVLLEPYGGEVLGLPVAQTTRLTGLLALGGVIGFWFSSLALSRGADAPRMSAWGLVIGIPGMAAIMMASSAGETLVFLLGVSLIGVSVGLFGHGSLTTCLRMAPKDASGLALGVWGAVQATAAGIGMACGGVLRDVAALYLEPAQAYSVVYALEMMLLAAALMLLFPLLRSNELSRKVVLRWK
ncbi:MFS_BCD_PucC-like domain containing protein [Burkholderiales bacterium]|jgi:MFS transporter, BCD family, chlorophyll transporter